jgi:hypothetical protein
MSETKFTPGPWRKYSGSIYAECQLDEQGTTNQYPLAEVTSDEYHDDYYDGNCHLIAAAPDMYGAIESLLGYIEAEAIVRTLRPVSDGPQVNVPDKELRLLQAALAKARGEA